MGKRSRRGDTKQKRYESYRIDAIEYVQHRDAKIAEIVADVMRKYPRMAEAEARHIVVDFWAQMERDNDVPNMVRSNYLGYDERGLIQRVRAKLARRLQAPDSLTVALSGLVTPAVPSRQVQTDPCVSEAVASISAVTGESRDQVQAAIDAILGSR